MNPKLDAKGNAMFVYLGQLEKWLLVQHGWAGTTCVYQSMPLPQGVPKIPFVVST